MTYKELGKYETTDQINVKYFGNLDYINKIELEFRDGVMVGICHII